MKKEDLGFWIRLLVQIRGFDFCQNRVWAVRARALTFDTSSLLFFFWELKIYKRTPGATKFTLKGATKLK